MSGRSIHLIDRDELLRNIEADIDISVTGVRNMEAVKCCLQNILDDVKESPVVDAVPVIRCKDCKRYREYTYLGTQKFYVCERDYRKRIYDMKEDDFCSRGERKEE